MTKKNNITPYCMRVIHALCMYIHNYQSLSGYFFLSCYLSFILALSYSVTYNVAFYRCSFDFVGMDVLTAK